MYIGKQASELTLYHVVFFFLTVLKTWTSMGFLDLIFMGCAILTRCYS